MSSLEMSQYAQVLFLNVPKNYQLGANVEVKYTITSQLQPTKADWLGIFKIGWCSASPDALHRVWIELPEKYEPGQPANCVSVFEGAVLPTDTEEFYQFCYINSKGHVRGASTPFQFRRSNEAGEEDFVEEDIEDMLVVTSRSAVLDGKLDLAMEKINVLVEEKLELVKDRQNLMLELSHAKKKQEEYKAKSEHLATNLEAQQLLAEELRSSLAAADIERVRAMHEIEALAKRGAERQLEQQAQLNRLQAALEAARGEAARQAALLRDRDESSLAIEARHSARLLEVKEQLHDSLAAYDQLLAQFSKVNDDLQGERRRFTELELTLTSSQATVKDQLRQTEERLRVELDAALLASRSGQSEAAELRAQLERLQDEDRRLRQALSASEDKIKELIGHNATLVEETGHEQEEAKQVSSALHAELMAAKERLAEAESQLQQSKPPQGGGGGGGGEGSGLDSYHALLTAYEELKSMLRERTREKEALLRSERGTRAANGKLMLENANLKARLAAAEEEHRAQRGQSEGLEAGADMEHRRAASCAQSSLEDSWVCTSPTSAAATGSSTAGVDGAIAGSTGAIAAAAAERERHATIERQLRGQMLASDEYYMSHLRLLEKDLEHERERRQELQRLLHRAASRCACSEISEALSLGRPQDRSLGGAGARRAAGDVEKSTTCAGPRLQTAPGGAASDASGSRERRCSSTSSDGDDDGGILEPPIEPFLLTVSPSCRSGAGSRAPAASSATRLLGPPPTANPDAVNLHQRPSQSPMPPAAFGSLWLNPMPPSSPSGPPPVSDPGSRLPQPFSSTSSQWSQYNDHRSRSAREPPSMVPESPPAECCVCRERFEPHLTIEQRTDHVNGHFM